MGSKKHKKHKSDRWGRYETAQGQSTDRPQLRLILKVGGGSSTPEADHSDSSAGLVGRHVSQYVPYTAEDESRQSSYYSHSEGGDRERHKKKKEKKKKKNKDKDKERKKHKHHKEKKYKERTESNHEEESFHYEVVSVEASNSQNTAQNTRPIIKISANTSEPGWNVSTSTSNRTPRISLRPRHERPALQKLLELLLPSLERKDPRQFFAWPVTDNIAPGYSQIITKPMDFSTMRQKIDENEYKTLQEFTDDFVLMCNNAMTYNQPDTIYYKAAKRLLHAGMRIVSPEKIRPLVPTISNYGELTSVQLGFEPLEESFKAFQNRQTQNAEGEPDAEGGFSSGGETTVETARDTFLKNEELGTIDKMETLPDDMTPDEILEQVQEAAQIAAVKLDSQHPNAKMGFIRQRKDGTTSLAILAPCDPVTEPGSTEVPVSLGVLTGKVQPGPGTGQLAGFREDRRNIVKHVKPLYYGPFGSYAPSYDSTFANLNKDESDLVLSTYGDDTGVQYAESILDFVRDCDYALHIADDLLNLMTHGEHSTIAKILEEKKRTYQQQQQQQQQIKHEPSEEEINFNSLRTLGDLGIDVSFLDTFEAQMKAEQSAREISQNYLDETGSLISNLEKVQRERLSRTPPPHLSNIAPPSDIELQLAEKITEGITFVAKQTNPGSIASTVGLRKAMGISVDVPLERNPPPVAMETDPQRDLESELSELLGEDGVSDVMTDIFH
nr:EOG090X04G3 [Cyclestheria hislopi]